MPLPFEMLTALSKAEGPPVMEAPEDLFRRVANNIARDDLISDAQAQIGRTEEAFNPLLSSLDFLSNSKCPCGYSDCN